MSLLLSLNILLSVLSIDWPISSNSDIYLPELVKFVDVIESLYRIYMDPQ